MDFEDTDTFKEEYARYCRHLEQITHPCHQQSNVRPGQQVRGEKNIKLKINFGPKTFNG